MSNKYGEVIDCFDCLDENVMRDILDLINDNDNIIVYTDGDDITYNKANFYNFLSEDKIKEYLVNNDMLIWGTNNLNVVISKKDYEWWSANTRRKNKLFGRTSSSTTKPKTTSKNEYSIECAFKLGNNINDNISFTGTKKECIDFINNYIKTKKVDNFLEGETLISFNIDDLEDEKWYSIEDLEKKGMVKLL